MGSRHVPSHLWPNAHFQSSHQPSRCSSATAAAAGKPQSRLAQATWHSAGAAVTAAGSTSYLQCSNKNGSGNCGSLLLRASSSSSVSHITTAAHAAQDSAGCKALLGTADNSIIDEDARAQAVTAAVVEAVTDATNSTTDTVADPAAGTSSEATPLATGADVTHAGVIFDSSNISEQGPTSSSSRSTGKALGGWQLDEQLGKRSYRMVVAYDGTAYSGWQLQASAPTIQALVEKALSTVLREGRKTLCVSAAGRTDAGVHAQGQVVQFYTDSSSIDSDRLPFKLNSLLPHDIRVQWMSQTAPDFIVTASAIRKTYHYHLDTGKAHDPLRHRYSHHCRRPLHLEAMRAAAALLTGTHDFTQFSNESKERLKRNPIKTVERLDIMQDGPTAVRIEVQGSGFLYKQVRHMTGALLAVGEGRMGLDDIVERIEVGGSQAPGAGGVWRGYNVAPAKGLQLFEVEYPAAVDDPSAILFPELPHDDYGRLIMRVPGASSVDEE